MAAFEGRSGVRECSERLRQARALQLHVRRLGLRQAPLAHPQVITCKILTSLGEQHKFLTGRGVHLAGIACDNFVKKGGHGPTQ
jgi:hypothetical protein